MVDVSIRGDRVHGDASAAVAALIDRIGFDAVNGGSLAAGTALEPGTQIFNGSFTTDELVSLLGLEVERAAS